MTTFGAPLMVNGNAAATSGWVLTTQKNTVAYTDDGTAKDLFTLPKPYHVVEIYVDVTTAFNGTGTDLLNIGVSGDSDRFAASLDVSAAGRVLASSDASQLPNYTDATTGDPITIQGLYADATSDASAGAATLTVVYATISTDNA